mmetsp:Transcript_55601/g.95777  ORF Transcript_55601/g.95777 Transcript_55601/m.95777 type:complete len:104 (+) Transcript_55601:2-313(+)
MVLSLHWPTELSLPDQLPLFVSAGFIGIEALLKAWRWGSNRFGFSHRDEFLRRLHGDDYCLKPLRRRGGEGAAAQPVQQHQDAVGAREVGQDASTLEITTSYY